MDQTLRSLADKIVDRYSRTPAPRRLLVGVAGIPGSGKSTCAGPLTDLVNTLLGCAPSDDSNLADGQASAQVAIGVGLDGWHHSREALAQFPDPVLAAARRGAAFTFDASSYSSFIAALRAEPAPPSIPFPTFDHALKDPSPSLFPILPSHRIVIVEGLYAFINTLEWIDAAQALDERIWVDTPFEVARERVVRRNFAAGIEPTLEATYRRVDDNDMPNGVWIKEHLLEPTEIIYSTDDPTFVSP